MLRCNLSVGFSLGPAGSLGHSHPTIDSTSVKRILSTNILILRMSQRLVKINCRSISELDNHMSLDWIKMCNLSLLSQSKSRKTEVSRSFLCRSSANIVGIRRESHSFRLLIIRFRISGIRSSVAQSLFGRVKIISQELRLSLSPIVSLSIYSLGLAISLKRLSGISIYRICDPRFDLLKVESFNLTFIFTWLDRIYFDVK